MQSLLEHSEQAFNWIEPGRVLGIEYDMGSKLLECLCDVGVIVNSGIVKQNHDALLLKSGVSMDGFEGVVDEVL